MLNADVTVFSDGTVTRIVPLVMQSSCAIDVTHFPVDQQTCLFQVRNHFRNIILKGYS